MLFFVVGYAPTLVYFVTKVRHDGDIRQDVGDVGVYAHVLSFLGVSLTSCLNPTIILLRVEHFKSRSIRRKGSLTRTLSSDQQTK